MGQGPDFKKQVLNRTGTRPLTFFKEGQGPDFFKRSFKKDKNQTFKKDRTRP